MTHDYSSTSPDLNQLERQLREFVADRLEEAKGTHPRTCLTAERTRWVLSSEGEGMVGELVVHCGSPPSSQSAFYHGSPIHLMLAVMGDGQLRNSTGA